MANLRIIALADTSPYVDDVLRMAKDLSQWCDGDLHVLSEAEVVMPGLLDNAAKAQAKVHALEQVRNDLAERLKSYGAAPSLQVVDFDVLEAALGAMPERGFFVAGIKGSGILRRIFMGSTVVKLIERSPVPVIAVPRGHRVLTPLHLYVGVAPGELFEPSPVRDLVAQLGRHVGLVTFFSVASDGAKAADAALEGLRKADADCALKVPTTVQVLSGELGLAGLKDHAASDPHALLVLRRGGRELTDQLFRRYFINELVYEGRVPLVTLP